MGIINSVVGGFSKVIVVGMGKFPSRQFEMKCYGCGKIDHKVRDCKLVKQKAAALVEDRYISSMNSNRYQNDVNRYTSMRGRGKSRGGHRDFPQYRRSDNRDDPASESKIGCCVRSNMQKPELEDKLPVMSVACKPPIHDVTSFNKMPTADGYIGNVKVAVLRDTCCSSVIVRRDLVLGTELTGEVQQCALVDGTVRKFPKALVDIKSLFFTGKTEGSLCVEGSVYPFIIGNVTGIKGNVGHSNLEDMSLKS